MKIILVDDQTLIRKGIISMLANQSIVEVAGEAKNKKEAILMIKKLVPDLVILNFYLNKEASIEVINEVRQLELTCKFLVLIDCEDTISFELAKTLDVEGYISLDAHPDELLYAIQIINYDRKYYDPTIIDYIMQTRHTIRYDNERIGLLTSKEKEILEKLGIGFSNKQIGVSLFITENTVKKHVGQVLSKLDLIDRTHAALYANATGLVQYRFQVLV